MGMFDKDKEIGTVITNLYPLGQAFIVWGVRIKREDYPTTFGPTPQTELTTSKLDSPNDKYEVTTLAGAIAAKAREAEPSDFPAVVCLAKVPASKGDGDALVLQYLKPYGREATGDTPRTVADVAANAGDGGTV